ncbi:MAG TPA: TIGR03118 family protein, partial [Pirellulales bacterium]
SGNFIKRLATGTAVGGTVGALNSPFGMTVAPAGFGPAGSFGGTLLVGNFGDSHVSVFNIQTGAFLGQLSNSSGTPLTLNGGVGGSDTKGLWGIGFGNGHGGTSRNTLFFAAGINGEGDGLFGEVSFKAAKSSANNHSAVNLASGTAKATAGASVSTTTGGSTTTVGGGQTIRLAGSLTQPPSVASAIHLGARDRQLLDQLFGELGASL